MTSHSTKLPSVYDEPIRPSVFEPFCFKSLREMHGGAYSASLYFGRCRVACVQHGRGGCGWVWFIPDAKKRDAAVAAWKAILAHFEARGVTDAKDFACESLVTLTRAATAARKMERDCTRTVVFYLRGSDDLREGWRYVKGTHDEQRRRELCSAVAQRHATAVILNQLSETERRCLLFGAFKIETEADALTKTH